MRLNGIYHSLVPNTVESSLHLPPSSPSQSGDAQPPAAPGWGSHSPPHPRALRGESKAPLSLGPMEGKQPESAATRPRSTCCPLSCSCWPPSRWVPCPLQPACQEADGWAHVHCSCGARQCHAWLQGQWSVPGDNQRRQVWPVTVGLRPPLSAVRPGQPFI